MTSPTFAGITKTVSNFDFKDKKYENNDIPSRHSQQIYKDEEFSTKNENYFNKIVNGQNLQREFSQASFRPLNELES